VITPLVYEGSLNSLEVIKLSSERDFVLRSTPDQEIHSRAMTCFEKLLQKYFAIEITASMETGLGVYG